MSQGESIELDYIFELPLDATNVRLQAGEKFDPSNRQATYPLDLPDLPEMPTVPVASS